MTALALFDLAGFIDRVDDPGAIRHWRANATPEELRWARSHPQLSEVIA